MEISKILKREIEKLSTYNTILLIAMDIYYYLSYFALQLPMIQSYFY